MVRPNFNSIKVQLKQIIQKPQLTTFMYFNSIKVQLKHLSYRNILSCELFQFHKGTIKTLMTL